MKKNLLKFIPILFLLVLFPSIAFAATTCSTTIKNIGDIICKIGELLNAIVPVLVALGLVYFIWGVVKYVIADGEEAKTKGKDQMIYGIIGFAVIVGLWGLVNILVTTFGLGGVTFPTGATGAGVGACTALTSASKFQDLLGYITCIIAGSVIPLLFAGAAVMFIWGVVNFFIINADEEAKRAQGRQFMIWGVIALTVMLSVWGLVNILGGTFGITTNALPTVRPPGASSCSTPFVGACSAGQHNDGCACVPD